MNVPGFLTQAADLFSRIVRRFTFDVEVASDETIVTRCPIQDAGVEVKCDAGGEVINL